MAFESLTLTFTVRPAGMLKRLDPSLIRFATALRGRSSLRTVLSVSLPWHGPETSSTGHLSATAATPLRVSLTARREILSAGAVVSETMTVAAPVPVTPAGSVALAVAVCAPAAANECCTDAPVAVAPSSNTHVIAPGISCGSESVAVP